MKSYVTLVTSEDERGNREDFYSYQEIPAYTVPDQDETVWPRITGVTVISDTQLKVVFDKSVGMLYENKYTQISGLGGSLATMVPSPSTIS